MAVTTKNELIAYLKNNKARFKEEYGVNKLGFFGSFAYGSQNATSDIDLIIEMAKGKKNLHNFMSFKRRLERETARKVDLGFENSLKPQIRNKITDTIIYV